jgi:hypothetical protein
MLTYADVVRGNSAGYIQIWKMHVREVVGERSLKTPFASESPSPAAQWGAGAQAARAPGMLTYADVC